MIKGENFQSEPKRKNPSQRTLDEMEAGRKATLLYGKLAKVEEETKKIKLAFPSLLIGTVLNRPYTHVTLRARQNKIAPLDSFAVLVDEFVAQEIEITDPIDGYPSDHLIAQLALIA